ncbi:hypothetical protein UCRPC4_g03093 [Phaeomoniella chlamydospora]|uniref:Uncharacterized protein n=1 Tax=Phaeomoniella chlamydospora TaxID=158046 RepID=A0A0G2EIU7_PHACM|nr:hypothetical protein UCRPC4_g03093 [Phaeomoniella chlamydospora]
MVTEKIAWPDRFNCRRKNIYKLFDEIRTVKDIELDIIDTETLMRAFFEGSREQNVLIPPDFNCEALWKFMKKGSVNYLRDVTSIAVTHSDSLLALIDDRRDEMGDKITQRPWESESYMENSPNGINDYFEALSERGLFWRLRKTKVRAICWSHDTYFSVHT